MKIGVIIIFHNNALDINPKVLIDNINTTENIKICFVDNESKDETYDKLLEIKESCQKKVAIVQIKKKVSRESAKRAGARFMFNDYNLKHLGFIDANVLVENKYNLNQIIESVCLNTDNIIAFDKEKKKQLRIKSSLFKSVFSILEYFKTQDLNKCNSIQQSLL